MFIARTIARYMSPLRTKPLGSVPIPTTMAVQLTDSEDRLCALLDACATHLREENLADVTCRIAGGWVRDKLLGLQSNDIDVALSNMMGLAFAQHLATFAHQKGVETGTISKIAQNPDQSKHLETATLKIFDLDIDLVNLRSEEYANDSRIPTQVTFGTPLQDALRRDITINTLFYNIHTRSVEDFTEKGLADLANGIIRTPLPPRETFLDDPLRVLRCVRFSGRFGFNMVPDIKEAAKDPTIQVALVSKVTRERIGEEISKMITGRDPLHSIQLIHELSLYDTVFFVIPGEIEAAFSEPPASGKRALASATILHELLTESVAHLPPLHPLLFKAVRTDASCIPRLYLASLLTPFACITYADKKQRVRPAAGIVLRESLKLGAQNHYLDGIPHLFSAHQMMRDALHDADKYPSRRVAIGTLLRDKSIHNPNTGSHWTSSVLFSLIQDLIPCYRVEENTFDVAGASKIIEQYNIFLKEIDELDLVNVTELKSIIDGRELLKVLGISKGGSWTGELLARVMEWQLENPAGTKDSCIEWLKSEKEASRLRFLDEKISPEPASKRARTK